MIEGTELESRIAQLYTELEGRGISFQPHCWLSDEWFSPDGVPGIALPFYLAHPRLKRLEGRMMHEVEGGTRKWCMQLLRHEAGHAIEMAYGLHRRQEWRRLFGKFSIPYPEYYSPSPRSERFVHHLDWWYAQSHPYEDFAETFAVWLTPRSRWRVRYANTPAMRKLIYVDGLMGEISSQSPRNTSRAKVSPLHELSHTLREHYSVKQSRYEREHLSDYDEDLRKMFSHSRDHVSCPTAASFLRLASPELRRRVASRTGEPQYAIDLIIRDMIGRCRELRLRAHRAPVEHKRLATRIIAEHVIDLMRQRHRLAV